MYKHCRSQSHAACQRGIEVPPDADDGLSDQDADPEFRTQSTEQSDKLLINCEGETRHPHCPHGPTLLVYMKDEDLEEGFYACAAFRDRKLCNYHVPEKYKLLRKMVSLSTIFVIERSYLTHLKNWKFSLFKY
uniref:Uncharacterized protein n=1 Tax=Glossina palpalis gambiensis TaxID=67801 RepID=A0A1B0BH43_9MUSC